MATSVATRGNRVDHKPHRVSLFTPSGFCPANALTLDGVPCSFHPVRRVKCSLSWALLGLMFAMALVPANGLTVFHSHDDDDHHDHGAELLSVSDPFHVIGSHHDDGLHSHRVGWSQIQEAPTQRVVGAPVLVAQIWLDVPRPLGPADHSTQVLRRSAESKLVHAPPSLLRSMAFLI